MVRNCGSKTFLPHRIAVKPEQTLFPSLFHEMSSWNEIIRINKSNVQKAIYKRWELHVLSTCWVPLVRQFAISYVMSLSSPTNPPLKRLLEYCFLSLEYSSYLPFSCFLLLFIQLFSPKSPSLRCLFDSRSLPRSHFPALLCFIFIIVFLTNKNTEV